jgi:hypothetical protein
MPRAALQRRHDRPAPDPIDRTLEDISGDIRDRLTALLNAAQLIRLASPGGDPNVLSGLRMIEQQVKCLGRLADELWHDGQPAVPAGRPGGPPPRGPAATVEGPSPTPHTVASGEPTTRPS